MKTSLADAFAHDEFNFPAGYFLVNLHCLDQALRRNLRGDFHRQTGFLNQRHHPLQTRGVAKALINRKRRGFDHADSDSFAVEKFSVPGGGFQSVPDGVTEVEHGAVVVLALVGLDNSGFDGTRRGDDPSKHLLIEPDNFIDALFEHGKQRRVFNDAVLDDLGKAGNLLSPRQRT